MSRLTKAMAVVLLVFYGLAISHCDLEQVPALSFLSCCEHSDCAPHQDNDCEQDACSVVESGFYRVNDYEDAVPVPLLVLSCVVPEALVETILEAAPDEICSSAPPELPRVWRFYLRTALPPRAPAFVS